MLSLPHFHHPLPSGRVSTSAFSCAARTWSRFCMTADFSERRLLSCYRCTYRKQFAHTHTHSRGAGAYKADTANAAPLFWLVWHTMHFAVPLFRPITNIFPINLILGAVSRRNEIMFTVSLFWHYFQNTIVQRIFKIIRFTSNKTNFYLHQQRTVALKYAKNVVAAEALPRTPLRELKTLPQSPDPLVGWEGNTLSPHPTS